MPMPDRPQPSSLRRWPWVPLIGLAAVLGLAVTIVAVMSRQGAMQAQEKKVPPPDKVEVDKAPELEGGLAWINTANPVKLKDLRGKIVLIDFWTLCCINCIHTLPDLEKLEKKYANELVVIGVHSPKFDNEKDTNSIRKAVQRYEIHHPVVNDADRKIWDAYEATAWPTLALIDPEGKLLGTLSGEGKLETLDGAIAKLIKIHREKKTLNEKPIRFDSAAFREKPTSLYFPGKVLADAKGKRIFIADSTHHRIVVVTSTGEKIAIAGAGTPGKEDGPFAKARFDEPQGMTLSEDGNTLYVADRRNHLIRALYLKTQTVKTIAGTGEQDRDRSEGGPALERGLNSPWDLWRDGERIFIAMAGHHQIWLYDLKEKTIEPYAGDGRENIKDGPLFAARFAQCSGLSSDGKYLYVADPEVSAVRRLPMNGKGRVETLVGTHLFEFGDHDGLGVTDDESKRAQLQHAIAVAYADGLVYVADTYNNKIRTIDPKTTEVKTYLGGPVKKGEEPLFNEPAGLSYADGKLYVADTNAHRIRIIDLKTKAVSTLELKGVEPVAVAKE